MHPGQVVRELNDRMVRRPPDYHDEAMFPTGLHLGPAGLPIGLFDSDSPCPESEPRLGDLGRRIMAYTDKIVE